MSEEYGIFEIVGVKAVKDESQSASWVIDSESLVNSMFVVVPNGYTMHL